jgi:hypothetical protein
LQNNNNFHTFIVHLQTGMEKENFYKALQEARKMSGLSITDLVIKLHKTDGTLRIIFSGKQDNTMQKLYEIIHAIGYCLEVHKDAESVALRDNDELGQFIIQLLQKVNQPTREIGKNIGVSYVTVQRILRGGAIRLSVFLQILKIHQYELSFVSLDAIDL